METPLQIDLEGIDERPDIRAEIGEHVAQLEERSGRITAGRVVVKAPSGHHRTGGLYEITIHLSLPDGREVNIGRTPQNDERYADIDYALNDAFKRARRQLQDEVRKMQGQVKHHEGSALRRSYRSFPLLAPRRQVGSAECPLWVISGQTVPG
jgi:ribosome-associated translation inhibitor RaiA